MKVILKAAVAKLGKEGQVVTVKDGYARNFLFPKGMAVVADRKQVAAQDRRNAKLAADLAATKASAEAMRDRINGKTVKIEGNVGRDGVRLFGAVTSENIAEAVKAQLGETVEKKQVVLVNPIKRLGRFYVELDMHRQVDMHITVHVFDPANPDLDEPVASAEVEEDEATEEPADEA